MSKRFLKYETEANNPNVDENGVLTAGGSGTGGGFDVVIIVRDERKGVAELYKGDYNKLIEKVNNREPIMALICMDNASYDNSYQFNYNYPHYVAKSEHDNNRCISVYNSDSSVEYKICFDNSVVVNDIG